MFNSQSYSAAGVEPAALCRQAHRRNFKPFSKQKPAYYQDFLKCENQDLILIAADWNTLNFLRRLGGRTCLLCENSPQQYDLSFCWEKEVWVLYQNDFAARALDLAHTVQRNGARKINLISVNIEALNGGKFYDRA